jgi:hypothetical protein
MSIRVYNFPDGFTSASTPILGAGIGMGQIKPQQELIGTGDGVTASFNLSDAPSDAETLLIFVNGVERDENTYALLGNVVTFIAGEIPALGQSVYAYYCVAISGGGGGGASVQVEYRTITLGEETAKAVTLVNLPLMATGVMLSVIGGCDQFYGLDFTVSGSTLSWSGLGLDGLLTNGERVVINYSY